MRLTNEMRHNILLKATASLPKIDYRTRLTEVVQEAVIDAAPVELRPFLRNEKYREFFHASGRLYITGHGEHSHQHMYLDTVYHPTSLVTVRTSYTVPLDPRVLEHKSTPPVTVAVAKAIIKSGYFDKQMEQDKLLAGVRTRLEATLKAVNTTKALREVLEPELHYLIPEDQKPGANLPAMAGAVVDDMRKLGAEFPATATAKK